MDIEIRANERVDFLGIDDMVILQNTELYTFTSDAVVLANSVRTTSRDRILDIGTGSAIIPLIIAHKHKVAHIDGVEIQEYMADMARRSVEANGLTDTIDIINGDIKEYRPSREYDIIVTNPPYFAEGQMREREEIAMSRHEVSLTLAELISCAARMLKFGGKFYMVHKCTRLAEAITLMSNSGIIPKVVTLVYPKASLAPDTFIIEGKSHAQHGLTIKRFVMYNEDGTMTDDAYRMYNKES